MNYTSIIIIITLNNVYGSSIFLMNPYKVSCKYFCLIVQLTNEFNTQTISLLSEGGFVEILVIRYIDFHGGLASIDS